jgi:hypothetical protein
VHGINVDLQLVSKPQLVLAGAAYHCASCSVPAPRGSTIREGEFSRMRQKVVIVRAGRVAEVSANRAPCTIADRHRRLPHYSECQSGITLWAPEPHSGIIQLVAL